MSAKPKIRVPTFTPRAYQLPYLRYHDNGGLRSVWTVCRRGGKDLTALNWTHLAMWKRPGAYWHIFPTSEQGRKAIWTEFTADGKRIMDAVFPPEVRKSPKEWTPSGEMVVELKNGAIWRLIGSDKVEVVGAGPMGVVFSEYAMARPKVWQLIQPMLMERGGWASFISTPRGKNHFHELREIARKDPQWFCELLTVYDTGGYPPGPNHPGKTPDEILAEARASGMDDAMVRQEYLCDFSTTLSGSVWGDILDGLDQSGLLRADFEHPVTDVYTHWDLGLDDSTAIWFWRFRPDRSIEFIDYFEDNSKPMPYYFEEISRRESEGWTFKMHNLPHDARARTLLTGTSVMELCLERWGSAKVSVVPKMGALDGIQAARKLLMGHPTFHRRCREGVDAICHYHRAWDEALKRFADKPVHDWSSHAADALKGVAASALVLESSSRPVIVQPPVRRILEIKPITMDEALAWARADARGTGRV